MALLKAETEFIGDPDRRSVEYWFDQAGLGRLMALDSVRRYAHDQRWHERRQAFWRGVKAAYLKQKHTELIRTRHAELREAQEMRDTIYRAVKPRIGQDGQERLPIQPRSYEGMVRAFATLDAVVEGKRDAILAAVEPMLAAAEESKDEGAADLPFHPNEMRKIAHGLLAARREARHADLLIEEDPEDDENGNEEKQPGDNDEREDPVFGSRAG